MSLLIHMDITCNAILPRAIPQLRPTGIDTNHILCHTTSTKSLNNSQEEKKPRVSSGFQVDLTHKKTVDCSTGFFYLTRILRPIFRTVFGVMPLSLQIAETVVPLLIAMRPKVSPDLMVCHLIAALSASSLLSSSSFFNSSSKSCS